MLRKVAMKNSAANGEAPSPSRHHRQLPSQLVSDATDDLISRVGDELAPVVARCPTEASA
jgi:hypothetical protein